VRVVAIPKIVAEKMIVGNNVAVISILDSDAERLFEDDHKTLTLWFDDIHPTTVYTIGSCYHHSPISYVQAKLLIEFVMKLDFNKINKIMVHCTAGICRSGAVVDFLRVVLDVNDIQFCRDNPNIIPNAWVRDLLWSVWGEQK